MSTLLLFFSISQLSVCIQAEVEVIMCISTSWNKWNKLTYMLYYDIIAMTIVLLGRFGESR